MNIGFLEGREKVQMMREIQKKMTIGHLYCPKIVCQRLGEKIENLDGRGGSPRRRCPRLGGPESK